MTLHEAIIKVLTNQIKETATTDLIADEINSKQLYTRRDKQQIAAFQVRLRTKLSSGKYHYLFEWIAPNLVKLKKQ